MMPEETGSLLVSESLLHSMQERFRWPVSAERFTLRRAWESRTAQLSLWSSDNPALPDIFVKCCPDWATDTPERLFRESEALTHILPERLSDTVASTPRPLGWTDSPPCIALAAIDGSTLSERVQAMLRAEHPVEASREGYPLIRRCGEALAIWHQHRRAGRLSDSNDLAEAEITSLPDHWPLTRRMKERVRLVRSAGDFALYNVLCTEQGALYLIDLPSQPRIVTRHYDVARFLVSLTFLISKRVGRTREVRVAEGSIRGAFLSGYASGAATHWQADDDRLASVYEAYFLANRMSKRWKSRRRTEALWYGWRCTVCVARAIRGAPLVSVAGTDLAPARGRDSA